ncbi:MAG: phage integrase N-terminal SAM-like domain-containing protein, partial [Dehalococcoidia bacterium]
MCTASGFSALLRGFRLALTVEGLRPHTIHSYLRDVERFTESVDGRSPRSISPNDIRAYIATLQDGRAPKTVREAQLALRRFFRFLVREGEIDRDPTSDTKLASFRVEPQPTYREAEVKRLLLACDSRTLEGIRDKALILTSFDTGVREGELVSMGLPQWERRIVRVDGKTGMRDVPLGTATLQAVERYVRRWDITEPPLWRGNKGPLTGSGVLQIVRRLSRRAGVTHKGVHAFRRAAAAQMKRLGMNDS